MPTPTTPLQATAARPSPAASGAAGALARAYDAHLAAWWRGEADPRPFAAWLAARWDPETAPPPGQPAALSPLGAGGRGIRWYEAEEAVLGVVPGLAGGYRVPRSEDPPPPPAFGQSETPTSQEAAMIGALHPNEVEEVLHRQHVGRLAVLAGGKPYIAPLTSAYAGGAVYAHTRPGRKLAALRADPRVAFEVDAQEGAATRVSVVAEGVGEEVADPAERRVALGLLALADPMVLPAESAGVVVRLRLTAKSGRRVAAGAWGRG